MKTTLAINKRIASPNFGERKAGARPEYVILHFTGMDDPDAACALLCDAEREVSAHYVLTEAGEIWQLVDEDKRAWHAGRSLWAGADDLNSRSIGIEIDNNGARPFTEAQYGTLIPLLRDICGRWEIPPAHVLGHSDIALGRKFDPGPWFDWVRLDAAGVSAPPKSVIESDDFFELLASAGYDASAPLDAVLANLRMRHGATPYFEALRAQDLDLLRKKSAP